MRPEVPPANRALERKLQRMSRRAENAPRQRQDLDDRTVVLEYFSRLVPDGVGPLAHNGNNLLKFSPDGLYVSCGDVASCIEQSGGLRFHEVALAASNSDLGDGFVDLQCDGTPDGDTQTLTDAASLASFGGTITLLNGDYHLNDSVTLYDNTIILGQGERTVVHCPSGAPAFVLDSDAHVKFENVMFEGGGPTGFNGMYAIYNPESWLTVRDCHFDGVGIWSDNNSEWSQVVNNDVTGDFPDWGEVFVIGGYRQATVEGNIFQFVTGATRLIYVSDGHVVNNKFVDCEVTADLVQGTGVCAGNYADSSCVCGEFNYALVWDGPVTGNRLYNSGGGVYTSGSYPITGNDICVGPREGEDAQPWIYLNGSASTVTGNHLGCLFEEEFLGVLMASDYNIAIGNVFETGGVGTAIDDTGTTGCITAPNVVV